MRRIKTLALWLGCAISLAGVCASSILDRLLHGAPADAIFFELPDAFGSWAAQNQLALPDDELEMLGAVRHWRRQYKCVQMQETVVATLIVGPAGRIAAHSPEVCYARRAYQPTGPARTVRLAGVEGSFRISRFHPRIAGQPMLTVVHAWNDGDAWRAPRSPRLALIGSPQVCRFQVTCQHPDWAVQKAETALVQFLQESLAGSIWPGRRRPAPAGRADAPPRVVVDAPSPSRQLTRRHRR